MDLYSNQPFSTSDKEKDHIMKKIIFLSLFIFEISILSAYSFILIHSKTGKNAELFFSKSNYYFDNSLSLILNKNYKNFYWENYQDEDVQNQLVKDYRKLFKLINGNKLVISFENKIEYKCNFFKKMIHSLIDEECEYTIYTKLIIQLDYQKNKIKYQDGEFVAYFCEETDEADIPLWESREGIISIDNIGENLINGKIDIPFVSITECSVIMPQLIKDFDNQDYNFRISGPFKIEK